MPLAMTVQLHPALCVFLPVHGHSLHHTVSEVVQDTDLTVKKWGFVVFLVLVGFFLLGFVGFFFRKRNRWRAIPLF